MDYTMRAYLILFLLALITPILSLAEVTNYKSFDKLTKEESKATAIYIEHDRQHQIRPPQNDFIVNTGKAKELFDRCQEFSTMLVFTQDMQGLLHHCESAFDSGAVDAYYLIGEHLMSAEWTTPDYLKAVDYLLKGADAGSREAKRKLISYYTNPLMPTRDSFRAINLAEELSNSGFLWDEFRYAALISIDANKELALLGYTTLIKLAQQGYPNATAMAALARVLKGPLKNMESARDLFDIPQDAYQISLTHAKLVFLITDNDLEATRELLGDCYVTSYLCTNMYYNFLQKGIGGDVDIPLANDILDYLNKQKSPIAKMFYGWNKATANEHQIYNPIAARQIINRIPEYKKNLPFYMDTFAAIYAANGNFERAIELQSKVIEISRGKGYGESFSGMMERLSSYKNHKRWVQNGNALSYIKRFRELRNITNIEGEIAAL